jgi:hypothetical protein
MEEVLQGSSSGGAERMSSSKWCCNGTNIDYELQALNRKKQSTLKINPAKLAPRTEKVED